MAKKRVKRKSSSKKQKNFTPQIASPRKVRRTTKSLIYSLAVFVISLVLYMVTYDFWESIFGLIMIISGSLVALFVIIEIIFYFVKRRDASK